MPKNIRLLKPVQNGKKVVAVIVTFASGFTYDSLFTSVEQKADEGSQVVVYASDAGLLQDIN